jgi:hypothetical protein
LKDFIEPHFFQITAYSFSNAPKYLSTADMDSTTSYPKQDGLPADQQSSDPTLRLPDKDLDAVEDQHFASRGPNEINTNERAIPSHIESSSFLPSNTPQQSQQPIMEPGETQKVIEDQRTGLASTASRTVSGHHVSSPYHDQSHLVQEEVNKTTESTIQDNDGADATQPEQSRPSSSSTGEEGQEIQPSMYPSLPYTTGLDVDSNPTETDHSDTDSAIGDSVYSSTFSTSSSVYNFVEENGRTYHRFKEGKYHLPNDEVGHFTNTPSNLLTYHSRSRKIGWICNIIYATCPSNLST